jgi:hypothetical protein
MSDPSEQALHALEAALSAEDRAFLDRIAEAVARRRMIAPALVVLESIKPLAFVSSQALHFMRPIVQSIVTDPVAYDRITGLLERRGAIELLLRRIEAQS